MLQLEECNFKTIYEKGTQNAIADALSRKFQTTEKFTHQDSKNKRWMMNR